MKILIIDNLTLNSEYIKDLLQDNEVDVQIYNHIQVNEIAQYDLIILTGTKHKYMGTVLQEWDRLKIEREIILNSNKPIIGICYGCELIAAVFGSMLEFTDSKITGDYEIKFELDVGFALDSKYKVYGNHSLFISELGSELESVARSGDSLEIFRHKSRPIYGLQFHPEKEALTTDGDEIFLRLVKNLTA